MEGIRFFTTLYVDFLHKVGSLTKSTIEGEKTMYRGDFFIKQNIRNYIYF